MTITAEELKTLDKAATQGEWAESKVHGPSHISAGNRLVVATGGYQDGRDLTRAENDANGSLTAALVKAYRSGQLVHVDEVEKMRAVLEELADIATDRAADAPEWKDSDSVSVQIGVGTLRAALFAHAALSPDTTGEE